jgi:hypothetical protein
MRSLVGGRLFKIDHLDRPDQTTAVVIAGQARASQQKRPTNVRFGSKADMTSLIHDVRFTPKSGHRRTTAECPLCAKSELMHCSNRQGPLGQVLPDFRQ